MQNSTAGRSVIVTGAASGIGRACADAFVRAALFVVCADKNAAGAGETAAELNRQVAGSASALRVDVRSRDDIQQMVSHAVDMGGRVDALVHCAGITLGRPFLDIDEDEWNGLIETNLHGSFRVCQAVARQMASQGSGSIVVIGSITGQRATSGRAAYAVSKAGVEMLARSMAVDLADRGIRVNCVAPGAVQTALAASAHTGDGSFIRNAYAAQTPMRRYAQPEEVARAALFLASDAASYITGQVLHVDGGFSATGMLAPARS